MTSASTAWEVRVGAGGVLEHTVPERRGRPLGPGEVRLRFLAGGVCGSDIGALAGFSTIDAAPSSEVVPLHEVVAVVVESSDARLPEGSTVVGTGLTGLASELVESADRLIPLPAGFSITEAVAIQPVSTVLRAIDALPPVVDRDVVVLGAGAIGLAFVHILKSAGARHVTVVDPVAGRHGIARGYGADVFVAGTGQAWASEVGAGTRRPSLVIDAVGREPALIDGALRAVADGGIVLGFGSASNGDYPIPFGEMYHRRLTLVSGRTRDGWVEVLDAGARYLRAHRADFDGYVSHRIPVTEAERAYELCSRPDASRIKVVLETEEQQ